MTYDIHGTWDTYTDFNAPLYTNTAYIWYFHTQSKAPWLFNGSVFISYEDELSIGYKAQYIKTKGLGGAMIWELSQAPNRILLDSLYNGLQ